MSARLDSHVESLAGLLVSRHAVQAPVRSSGSGRITSQVVAVEDEVGHQTQKTEERRLGGAAVSLLLY